MYRRTSRIIAGIALVAIATNAPAHEPQAAAVERHLHTFDTLDFDVFSNQKWDRLHWDNQDFMQQIGLAQ
jgi:hypothetical protein